LKDKTIGQKIAIAAAVIGLADSVYLSVEKLTHKQSMCMVGFGDCWTVNNSNYSEIMGIPIAIFGILTYLLLIVLLATKGNNLISSYRKDQITFFVSLIGFFYSIYLTYLEIAVIKAVCPFCVLSAVMISIIFVCSLIRLVQNQQDLTLSLEDKNG